MLRTLDIRVDTFPLAEAFVISRGAKTEAVVVTAALTQKGATGRGECVPYGRYGETIPGVVAQMESIRGALETGVDRTHLQTLLPPGAARNAIDCAMWDLEAKCSGEPVHALAGLPAPRPVTTAFTISVGTPEGMAAAARRAAHRPLLKIKLAGEGDAERLRAVRAAAPDSVLIVDANEAWQATELARLLGLCAELGVALVEQPLPAGRDGALEGIARVVPVCADESVHDRAGLEALRERYDAVNIKLDKTGGLTEALAMAAAAERLGFGMMIGCMVGSSLAMAPALLLAGRAAFVDLDGPLLLARDRPHGLLYEGSIVHPPEPALWG